MTMTWSETQARIVREASELSPIKVLITLLAAPFFVIGVLVGLVWYAGALMWQAVWVGVGSSRAALKQQPKSG